MNRNNSLHETEFIEKISGIDQLKTAIILEHALGIQNLPQVYNPYFSSLLSILQKSTKYQKQWFLVIRSARESNVSFRHYDNFSTNASLRTPTPRHPSCRPEEPGRLQIPPTFLPRRFPQNPTDPPPHQTPRDQRRSLPTHRMCQCWDNCRFKR